MSELRQHLDFEQPVLEVEEELLKAKTAVEDGDLSKASEVSRLEKKLSKVREEAFGNLTPYQKVQLSRHFERPLTLDYIDRFIEDFVEFHGDRLYGDDAAVVGGVGRFQGRPVMVVGHQRGRGTQERLKRNFGMTHPEGNRKAQRLFKLAEKFKLPLLNFIDTQGAYPGMEAEARGQAEAIAQCIMVLANLRTPIISTVIGEGGSGGALAFGVCDRLIMLENSVYSVITPEGCASILWGKSDSKNVAEYAKDAAAALKLDASSLKETNVVDQIVEEPPGGAHRDYDATSEALEHVIAENLEEVLLLQVDELLEKRYEKFRKIGLCEAS